MNERENGPLMQADLVIDNGRLVSETQVIEASLAVRDGRIALIGAAAAMPPTAERIDATGLHVLPGVIDAHVHFRDPGLTHKEDWTSGSTAAALGGVTCVFDMPNTDPPVDSAERLRAKQQLAEAKSLIDFGLYGLLSEASIAHLPELAQAGAIGVKLFLADTTGGVPCPPDGAILEGFETLARLGLRCAIHAENASIMQRRAARLAGAGRNDLDAHLLARNDICALEALLRSCVLAEWSGARIHIVHESTAQSLPYIRFFKERGVDLSVETLPQYLYLDIETLRHTDDPARLRMNPPIRSRAQQEPLWRALADGLIDAIGSDHAPHTLAEKQGATIWDVACGVPGVETTLPLMLNGVNAGRLSLNRLVSVTAANPARAWGLYGRKGVIAPGADADLTLVDLGRAVTLGAGHSKAGWSAFEGLAVRGWPVMTVLRGRAVMREGEVTGQPGWGRMVTPAMPAPAPRNVHEHLATLAPV